MKSDGTGPKSQPKRLEGERSEVVVESLQEPESLSRLGVVKTSDLVPDLTTEETEKDIDEVARREAAAAEMVRLSQELGLE